MRQFEGLSDFFRNATDEEKREVYLEVIEKANEEQLKVIEKQQEVLCTLLKCFAGESMYI